ncbi:MAG: hypothetical protein ACLQVN_09345 [Bryobacteraceae bacterium]
MPVAVAQPSPPSASLAQKVSTQYPAGTVLVVQKQGIVGASRCGLTPVAEYKDGQLHRPGKRQEIELKVIYLYKNVKVTFIDGKVSDIE